MTPAQNEKQLENTKIEQNNHKIDEQKKWIKIPKEDIFKNYKWYELFKDSLLSDPKYKKEDILKILEKVDELELQMYLDSNLDDWNLINLKIDDFINDFKSLITWNKNEKNEKNIDIILEKKEIENTKEDEKWINLKDNNLEEIDKEKEKIKENEKKEINEQIKNTNNANEKYINDVKEAQEKIKRNISKYNELFKWEKINDLIATTQKKFDIVEDLIAKNKSPEEIEKAIENHHNSVKELTSFLSDKNNAKSFFDKLSKEKPELYAETYQALASISWLWEQFKSWWIDDKPYIKEDITKDPRFPDAPEWKVEKRWDLLSYWDKLIDEKTGKAYIIWENWYKLETSLNIPNLTETKVKFQKERLEILESIDNSKNILNLLENKYTIKNRIENLEKQKTWIIWEDTQINIEINLLSKELEQIQNKLKQVVPNYNETQDDLLKSFLEKSIKEDNEKLEELEEKYTKEIKDLYEKAWTNVKENDEKTRETLNILDSIWFTLIPKNITDDIIATINKNPENYWFESRIDLKNWNFWWINNQLTKERFIKKINKMISSKETEPITTNEIDDILVKKIEKDKNSQEERNKELLGKFSTYWIINDLWIWDKEKLESNLILKEKETTNKETK